MTISNHAAKAMFEKLNGNWGTGKAKCPVCNKKNLVINDGDKVDVVLTCYGDGCSYKDIMNNFTDRYPNDRAFTVLPECAKREKPYAYNTVLLAIDIIDAMSKKPKRVKLYLKRRGIKSMPKGIGLLPWRQAKKLKIGFYDEGAERNIYRDLMVVPLTDKNGEISGCQVTPLDEVMPIRACFSNGEKIPRKTFGPIKGCSAVLGEPSPDEPLYVAEGFETALSAAQIAGNGVAVTTCGAINLKNLVPPPCSEIVFVADIDENGIGMKAAERACQELIKQGFTARVVAPIKPRDDDSWDANDALKSSKFKRFKERLLDSNWRCDEDAEDRDGYIVKSIGDVVSRPIEWLWSPFIVAGAVNTIYGDGGSGKSSICIDLASRVTKGKAMPISGEVTKGSILYLSKEETGSMLKARFKAADADLDGGKCLMITPTGASEDFSSLDDITSPENFARLERTVREKKVKLLVIDPINSFAGRGDIYKDTDVRRLMIDPLSRLAQQYRTTIIIVMHLNKARDTSARHRALGSGAFINAVRSACLVAQDREQLGFAYIVRVKGNFQKPIPEALGFMHKTVGKFTTCLIWESAIVEKSPEALLALKKQPLKRKRFQDEAVKYMREKGGKVSSVLMKKFAKQRGVHWRTANTAKKAAGIKSIVGKDQKRYWILPK